VNIFYLDTDPVVAAQQHCDKHVVKMILEYAQLLSTAHRLIDGEMYLDKTANGRNIKRWRLNDDREQQMYKASHVNHPSAIWARQSSKNYQWLYQLFVACCDEYTFRYGKRHLTDEKLRNVLSMTPINIEQGSITTMPQAMPDHCKKPDPIAGYRNYYKIEKTRMLKWTKRETPEWIYG